VERLLLVYYGAVVVYTLVVLSRFNLGPDNWRLSGLYYYDANDFATLTVTAMPLGLYFVIRLRRLAVRLLVLAGLAALAVAQIRSGSRGGSSRCSRSWPSSCFGSPRCPPARVSPAPY